MTSPHTSAIQPSNTNPDAQRRLGHHRQTGPLRTSVIIPCALLLGVALPVSVHAQDTTAKRVHVTADLGYVNTTGNTSLTSFNLGDMLTVSAGTVLITQTASVIYGRTSDVETANNQTFRLRGDQPLTRRQIGRAHV